MIAARDANIELANGRVTVSTFAKRPWVEIIAFLAWSIPWLAFGLFGLFGVFGRISPETMTVGIRCFLSIWLLLWFIGGAFFVRDGFLRAFSRLEILADSTGISLRRSFPLGSTSREYAWEKLEFVSEYLQAGRPYGGVIMRADGRLVAIDERLPNRVAGAIAEALGSVSPTKSRRLT